MSDTSGISGLASPTGAFDAASGTGPARSDRVEQFKQEIAAMKIRDPAVGRDRMWLRLGVGLMIAGLAVAIFAYPFSHSTDNALQQRDAITLGIAGLTAAIVGGALFLRYSLAGFLRFWLARLIYEQSAQTDRVLDGLVPTSEPAASGRPSSAPVSGTVTPGS